MFLFERNPSTSKNKVNPPTTSLPLPPTILDIAPFDSTSSPAEANSTPIRSDSAAFAYRTLAILSHRDSRPRWCSD